MITERPSGALPLTGGPPPRHEGRRESTSPANGHVLAVADLSAVPGAVPRLRWLARAVARGRRLSDAAEEALTVIVSELATNVILHSGSADLAVAFAADEATLTVTVHDRGRWRERPAPRCEAADMDADYGRGLALVDAYSVDTCVRRSAEGTLVRAVVAL
ncbi:ATP-binding protein [Streptomyces glaucescens]|uniref:ATP-binding protein n=1 Tax=Streptomyces glaucescens TaxID=1907 RepID=UPI000A37AD5C|nr:ATP-binding protein [Streptomyces glaucescens]